MQNLANEPLWSVDFATGEIINRLAAGDPVYNDDFTQVEIPLREGVAWDDGTPFTSADVVFTIETLMEYEGFDAHNFMVDNVASISAPDDYTVVFELTQANSRFHTAFLDRWGCTWIMPKHIFEGVEDPITFEFDPFAGTGPYKLHSYDSAGYWTIWEKREDWDKRVTLSDTEYEEYLREGCKFAGRCPQVMEICKGTVPADLHVGGVLVKCHLYDGDEDH